MHRPAAFVLLLLPLAAPAADRKELKPGFNIFTLDQDIQMGAQSAAEVRKTQAVVDKDELTGYLTRIAARLGKPRRAGKCPFQFAVRPDKSINGLARP